MVNENTKIRAKSKHSHRQMYSLKLCNNRGALQTSSFSKKLKVFLNDNMEQTTVYSGHKFVCLVSLVVLSICAVSSLLTVLYTNTQLMQVNERFVKLEGKLGELESSGAGQHKSHRPNGSDAQHRIKRSAPITLTGISTRLKTLENRYELQVELPKQKQTQTEDY